MILRLSVRKARLRICWWCNCTAEWRRTTWNIEFEIRKTNISISFYLFTEFNKE